ncbi:ABC transporter substrate-binding protein [Paenibacillus montanisoli]|uniref:Sugar ABC transporter substrate-binding protein n=1 Tax=Paenibacillus montanisoli TaxID=2081970 RepID=A0A328U3H6_9BACL|nr:extracellular solute-binding protein [Paenibacillus montanisoli]RAP77199.1 sugar ABC transporter substrate-binding protein [Paenibacillus montanisoli]
MRKRGSASLLLLSLALTLGMTACSSGGGNSNTSGNNAAGNEAGANNEPAKTEATTLSIMWWGPDARHEATKNALSIYTKQNANVTFKPEFMAWDAYWQKLPTLAASKSITDVLQMDAAFITEYVSRGQLEDLSDIDLSGIVDPKVIENLKIDGKLYGIPLSQNAQGIAYNKEELEKYGIALPKQNWTYDEFFQWARDAHAKLPEGKYPIGDSIGWDSFNFYQTSMGKDPVMAEEGKKFTLDKDLFMTYYKTYEEFRKAKIVPPAEQAAAFLENDPQADPMASGVLLTRGATTGSVSALEQLMPGKVGVVNMPIGPSGGGWAQSTIFLSVSANSKHKDEAKKFVQWFISDKEAGKALGLTRGIPINPEIYKELEPTLEPKDKLGKEIYDLSVEKALPFYSAAAGFTEWVDTYKKEMEAVTYGQQSIEDAYEKINKMGMDLAAKAGS